jgi:hypothetical protein
LKGKSGVASKADQKAYSVVDEKVVMWGDELVVLRAGGSVAQKAGDLDG